MTYWIVSKFILPWLWLLLNCCPGVYFHTGPWLGPENCQSNQLPDSQEIVSLAILNQTPDISAPSATVYAPDNNFWLFEQAATEKRPIASITKLMTALVFLDTKPDWEKLYTIERADNVIGGRLNLFLGDTLNLRDLFYTALISSDNGATVALARSTGLSQEEFVVAMNDKARSLNLLDTEFADPTGLSDRNLSTAKDVARLASFALDQEIINQALNQADYRFITEQGREKIIISTDNLLRDQPANILAIGGKTGYTDLAGYCFVGRFQDETGKEVFSVVLGASGRESRFQEASLLANWALTDCQW